MNNKTRIIIGVVVVVLFLIGMVALEHTETEINNYEHTKITNQNNTQINGTDIVEMDSVTFVKYSLDKDNSKYVSNDKSSKINTKSKTEDIVKKVSVFGIDDSRYSTMFDESPNIENQIKIKHNVVNLCGGGGFVKDSRDEVNGDFSISNIQL